jgi:predicted alpha/beta-fold hydrolase
VRGRIALLVTGHWSRLFLIEAPPQRYAAPVLADIPPFRPRWPWWGGDLQTLRNTLRPPRPTSSALLGERLVLALGDGSGDRLIGRLQRPPDGGHGWPLVVLIHGLAGSEDSAYMAVSAAALLGCGYPVLRLNLRGAGPSRPLCRYQYHAGRTGDLRAALTALDSRLCADGLLVVGYSLGGNMLLKFLAEYGASFPIRAAAAVSAPIDLAAAAQRILAPRNRLYHRHLLRHMKAETLAPAAELTAAERAAITAAANIIEFDDQFVASRNGFDGAADYYARTSAESFLPDIRVPTVIMHAGDDPWIPPHAYQRVAWRHCPHLHPVLPPHGGHVGFHGRGALLPWHDRVIATFFGRHVAQVQPHASLPAPHSARGIGVERA